MSELQGDLGERVEALFAAKRAISLSPLDPELYLFESYAARAAVLCERYEEALSHARASVRRNTLHAPSHRLLVGALWLMGRHDEARSAAGNFLRTLPGARVSDGRRSSRSAPARCSCRR